MKKIFLAITLSLAPVLSSWAAASVTVNKSGAGDFTTIQAAINSGASLITITDGSNYVENLEIGNQDTGGTAVTLTSNQFGTNRPVITPSAFKAYVDSARTSQQVGFGLFANNSVISNLILEAQPALTVGAILIMAQSVVVDNCLFRITPGTTPVLGASVPLLYFGQEGDGSGALNPGTNPKPGGRDCNGCLIRNCEFTGIAPDAAILDPTGLGTNSVTGDPDFSLGYIGEKNKSTGYGQLGGYSRMDHVTDGVDVFVTFEGCYFHNDRDYGIFPTDNRGGAGSVNVVIKKCRFDAQGKFQVRGRGANIFVENSVFSRCTQINNGDDENSAVAINPNGDGLHLPSGSVSNCVFINCGSANSQRAYYAGVNNHKGVLMAVDHCTFIDCLSGVSAGRGGAGDLSVSNSIFHLIGDNVPPAVDNYGITLTNGHPGLVNGQYSAATNGISFGAFKWSAVFNRFMVNDGSKIIIGNCLVGTVDNEDMRTWDDALLDNTVTGCRLFAGYDTNFVGANTVTRAIPVFVNTDPDAPNVAQLAAGSPGQGLGADLTPILSPKLTTSQNGNQLTISWTQPIWVKGVLKSTTGLNPPTWTPVAGVSNNSVTVTIGGGAQYYAVLKQ